MARSSFDTIKIFIVIFILLFLEFAVFDRLRIFGARPELLLIITLFAGFQFGIVRGAFVGALTGVLKDLFSITSFGVSAFSFLSLGLLAGLLKNKIVKDNLVTQFLISSVAALLVSAIYFLYFSETAIAVINFHFWNIALSKSLYTGILTPFLFLCFSKILKPKEA